MCLTLFPVILAFLHGHCLCLCVLRCGGGCSSVRCYEKFVGDKTVLRKGDSLELSFQTENGDKAPGWIIQSPGHGWRQAGFLSDEERAAGKTEIAVNIVSGESYVFVMAEGAYGRYRSPAFYFTVKEEPINRFAFC